MIYPSVNQFEMNPLWQQKKLRDFCKANVTQHQAMKGLPEIAEERRKTIAQVCIRWVYQTGATLVVKSYNKERLKQNVDIFDWELSKTDIEKTNGIQQRKMILREDLVSVNGLSPYKPLQDLWDVEL
ncbi:non-functional NADPH-dependent codeinone reductase 2-like [Pyrus ussuriensis x Pyrus communis]|uniref:Non-functional NADPH-dependent codeinone reductase 2-like n=1 Tax=Pyrus ussuriensis x Pyrus communis TaxID=2448454 RepID=A0A5N5IAJ3_9ROSA|nr:non-functional NADPH-dependent codeinone reductase 2-like [Pyrus ussuriensis x Pyrus communis]